MDTLENHLAALMASEAPAARDMSFELAVMARIERARFRSAVIDNIAIALVAAVVLFAISPWLGGLSEGISGNLLAALGVTALAVLAMQWSLQRMED